MRRIVIIGDGVAALALALSLAACGGGGKGPTGPYNNNGNTGGNTGGTGATANEVSIGGALAFNPSATTVAKGSTVTWTFNSCTGDGYGGQACVDHNVTWDDGTTTPSATQSTGSYTRTFANAGTYSYHCSIHGTATSGMRGSVTVQ